MCVREEVLGGLNHGSGADLRNHILPGRQRPQMKRAEEVIISWLNQQTTEACASVRGLVLWWGKQQCRLAVLIPCASLCVCVCACVGKHLTVLNRRVSVSDALGVRVQQPHLNVHQVMPQSISWVMKPKRRLLSIMAHVAPPSTSHSDTPSRNHRTHPATSNPTNYLQRLLPFKGVSTPDIKRPLFPLRQSRFSKKRTFWGKKGEEERNQKKNRSKPVWEWRITMPRCLA